MVQEAILNASCGVRGQLVTAETLHDLARFDTDLKAKVIVAALQLSKVLPHPPRRPGENWVRRFAHPVRRVRVRRTCTSATMAKTLCACFQFL